MKRILLVLSALLFAVPAFGQVPATDLMGLGMPGQLASKVSSMNAGQTADGADNSSTVTAGGGLSGQTRGASVTLYGNEHASNPGRAIIESGAVSGGDILNRVRGATGSFIVQNASGGTMWELDNSAGNLTSNATNGGGLIFSGSGDTISLQEATAGAACMGGLTANGATPVVVSTTCATTGARIFITRTSAESTAINAYVGTIVNGVSFSFTSEAADTGTYNWIIFKESP